MSRQIIEGVASYIELPEGGVGLDVGGGSGALTIACAKRNPQGRMVGIDRWGVEYASYSRKLCERNAQAEGVDNAAFQKGDARHLDFPDETFDAVTSNYVYHNITGADKQALLRETLRVLKKGGIFAIHDLMEPSRYGDMDEFLRKLREEGFQEARLLPTADGTFMTPREGKTLFPLRLRPAGRQEVRGYMRRYPMVKDSIQETLVIPLYGRRCVPEVSPSVQPARRRRSCWRGSITIFSAFERKSDSLMQIFGALEVAHAAE